MSAPFDNIVQGIHSFRPVDIEINPPYWVKVLINPQPPKAEPQARALWSRYSLDFHGPGYLPAAVESSLIDSILTMLGVLSVLRYKKIMSELDKTELENLIESIRAHTIYDAHLKLLAVLTAEYEYLVENETGVAEI